MKIGIICAGDTELAPFLPIIEECKISEKAVSKMNPKHYRHGNAQRFGGF